MKVESLIKEIYGIVEPMANELNLEIYHIEYVKEKIAEVKKENVIIDEGGQEHGENIS